MPISPPSKLIGDPRVYARLRTLAAWAPTRLSTSQPAITGITRDSAGAVLGGCTVDLFRTLDDAIVASTVSDGAGAFTLLPTVSGPFYLVAYLAGSPDVAGVSVNTLAAG